MLTDVCSTYAKIKPDSSSCKKHRKISKLSHNQSKIFHYRRHGHCEDHNLERFSFHQSNVRDPVRKNYHANEYETMDFLIEEDDSSGEKILVTSHIFIIRRVILKFQHNSCSIHISPNWNFCCSNTQLIEIHSTCHLYSLFGFSIIEFQNSKLESTYYTPPPP